ncbi:MAG: GNAT family N-acetyltransferase [Chitinophagaceae bacterium]
MDAKELYKKFSETHDLPLFQQFDWWNRILDEWYVITEKIDEYQAFFVFQYESKMGFKLIKNPYLTPYSGFIFSPSCDEYIKKKLVELLLVKIPKNDFFQIDLHPSDTDMDKYIFFKTYKKRTNYMNLTQDTYVLFDFFKSSLRRQIRKASKYELYVQEEDNIEQFYTLYLHTFQRQNSKPPVPKHVLERTWMALKDINAGKMLFVLDPDGNYQAAIILAYDKATAYYLCGGANPDYFVKGSVNLLLWHAILLSKKMGKEVFDFEGSMIDSINTFFKSFSPEEKTYYSIEKTSSALYTLLRGIKRKAT